MVIRFGRGRPVLLACLVVVTALPATVGAADSTCWSYSKSERKFARLTNEARVAAGLGKLSLDPELSRVARKHTSEMISDGALSHTPVSVLGKRVTRWRKLGENVGRGDGVSIIQATFMGSTVHKDNILKPGFRHVGVGTKRADGYLWVTVVFESKRDPGTTLAMPKC